MLCKCASPCMSFYSSEVNFDILSETYMEIQFSSIFGYLLDEYIEITR